MNEFEARSKLEASHLDRIRFLEQHTDKLSKTIMEFESKVMESKN